MVSDRNCVLLLSAHVCFKAELEAWHPAILGSGSAMGDLLAGLFGGWSCCTWPVAGGGGHACQFWVAALTLL